MSRLRLSAFVAVCGGLILLVGLVASNDATALINLLRNAGWAIVAVSAAHLIPMIASALAWRAAATPVWRASLPIFLWARALRETVSALLPVAQIGGDVIGARLLTFHGARTSTAAATVLVDVTLEFLTQIVFTVIGLALLLLRYGDSEPARWALAGLAIAIPSAAGLLLAQNWGLFRLVERIVARAAQQFGWPANGALTDLHATIMSIYARRRAIAAGTAWHLASWLLGAVEVWLMLRVLGADIDIAGALIIESLGQAVRSAAFLVPGALGVQEGAFLVLGTLFGLPPELGLSLSLLKRLRDLILGVPVLLAWQVVEGRRLISTSNPAGEGS